MQNAKGGAGKKNTSAKYASPNKRRFHKKKINKNVGIDPALLEKRAVAPKEEVKFVAKQSFADMPLNESLKANLVKKGFVNPSEIQEKTYEALRAGKDVLGIAQTGTGKTGAFLIPIIEQILHRKNTQHTHALVVVPTRELAQQVSDEFRSLGSGMRLFSSCFIGGNNINKDIQALRRQSHVIIGTPGRLLDLINRKVLRLGDINTLVLDEFDRMLDMGFIKDVRKICYNMQNRKQTLLFSATVDKSQSEMIDWILTDPVKVQVSNGTTTGDHIDQELIRIGSPEEKFSVLAKMIQDPEFKRVLIFDETKRGVSRLCGRLKKEGIPSGEIHGDRSQRDRQKALDAFKAGKINVLVATDVAARGIDVNDVSHVINYQIPITFDSYVHRIGHRGNDVKTVKAYTFVI